jgi:hypothetical protein
MSTPPVEPIESGFGVSEALDIVEGVAVGGIISVGTYIVAGAVSLLPGTFLPVAAVTPLSIVTGAISFVGVAVHQIRKRLGI